MEYYLSVLIFAFSTTIIPGSNNLVLMSSGVNYGFRRSIPHILGSLCGFSCLVVLVNLGLGAIFEGYPVIHLFVKIMGIGYLLFLAWLIANAGSPKETGKGSCPLTFLQAFALQRGNPKAWLVLIGAIASFTNPESNMTAQIIFFTLVFLAAGLFAMTTWLWLGASMASLFKTAKYRRCFNMSMALLLVVAIVPIALSGLE